MERSPFAGRAAVVSSLSLPLSRPLLCDPNWGLEVGVDTWDRGASLIRSYSKSNGVGVGYRLDAVVVVAVGEAEADDIAAAMAAVVAAVAASNVTGSTSSSGKARPLLTGAAVPSSCSAKGNND